MFTSLILTQLLAGLTVGQLSTPDNAAGYERFGNDTYQILVFSRTAGYRHDSIPHGVSVLSRLGPAHDFEATATEDPSVFNDASLADYDVVVFLNTTGDVLDDMQQAAFERFIRAGKGFVGIHSAADTEYSWAWYGVLVGAYFESHPKVQPAVVNVIDSTHPSTSDLPRKWRRTDEWYNYRANPPDNVHILATLDENSYEGGKHEGNHPIAWCHEYEGGRAWYTGGGHTAEAYDEPEFRKHLVGGIAYAAGAAAGNCGPTDTSERIPVIDDSTSHADVVGSWKGVLKTPGGALTIQFNLSADDDGTLRGTMDSPDQGARGIPLGTVTLDGDSLSATVPAAAGGFSGKVDSGKGTIGGFWSQAGQTLPLDLERVETEPEPAPPALNLSEDVAGSWTGVLTTGGGDLRIVFHLIDAAGGGLTGTMDSPDQGVEGIPLGAISGEGRTLRINVPAIGGAYDGEIEEGGQRILGRWSQGGGTLPLDLEAVGDEGVLIPERPQEPVAPFPYRVEDVRFTSSPSGVELAGTVTLPSTGGPFPAAVLISGSGPQDRDENVFGHKPFLVIADHLTRQGIAVLRFDDRGVGVSGGVFQDAVVSHFVEDARAAFRYLTTRTDIDDSRIGLVGHSEGGLVALLAGTGEEAVSPAYLVLLATPGVSGKELLYSQAEHLARAAGADDDRIRAAIAEQEAVFNIVAGDAPPEEIERELRNYLSTKSSIAAYGEQVIEAQLRQLLSPWFRDLLHLDPQPALRRTTCPVLALTGTLDLQVPPEDSLHPIETALHESGNRRVTAVALEGVNHLFQHAETGLPMEYARITETFSVEALEHISSWINAQVAG